MFVIRCIRRGRVCLSCACLSVNRCDSDLLAFRRNCRSIWSGKATRTGSSIFAQLKLSLANFFATSRPPRFPLLFGEASHISSLAAFVARVARAAVQPIFKGALFPEQRDPMKADCRMRSYLTSHDISRTERSRSWTHVITIVPLSPDGAGVNPPPLPPRASTIRSTWRGNNSRRGVAGGWRGEKATRRKRRKGK